MKIIFIIIIFSFLIGCQKHDHTHQHDAPGSYKQSVNQRMYLPFHIEQKYENSSTNSNDVNLEIDYGLPNKTSAPPTKPRRITQHVKKK